MGHYDFLYNPSWYGDLLYTRHHKDLPLSWHSVPEGLVLPHKDVNGEIGGGLLDAQENYIDGTGIHRGMGCRYPVPESDIPLCDEDAVYLGLWPAVWGHCLTDNIRRLWVLKNPDFMDRYGHLKFLYVPMDQMEPQRNFRELLEILGVGEIQLEPVCQPVRYRNIFLPDECFWREEDGTRMFSKEYVELVDNIRDYAEGHLRPTKEHRVYFTYRKSPSYRVIGEKRIEKFFAELGYQIIAPEEYDFSEQLNILLNCREFASTVGSASHNSVFLRNGTKVYLIPRSSFITEYQFALDQVHDLEITYVDSSLSVSVNPDRPWDGPFYYMVSRNLQNCFGRDSRCRSHRMDFFIYRHLGYDMNEVDEIPVYFKDIYKEYFPKNPEQINIHPWIAKLCRRRSVRKWISLFLA